MQNVATRPLTGQEYLESLRDARGVPHELRWRYGLHHFTHRPSQNR